MIEQILIFSAHLLASCGCSIIPADDNNQFPHWVKQYDFLDWAEDWKSRTLCPNLILPMICSLTLGKEFHFSFLIYKMRIMILSLYPHRDSSSGIVHKEWQIFAMCNVWVLYYSISNIKLPCRHMRDSSRVMFSTLCTRIAAKHSGYQTNLMERKNAINSRRRNPAFRNCLFDLTTEGLSMNFQNYAKGNLDYSPCKIASELGLN